MATLFVKGFWITLGVVVAVGLIALICMLIRYIVNTFSNKEDKCKFILDNWGMYIRCGYFEELNTLKPFKNKIERGEWPKELDNKFEWTKIGKGIRTGEEGDLVYYQKQILTLKKKYKFRKENNKKNDKGEQK